MSSAMNARMCAGWTSSGPTPAAEAHSPSSRTACRYTKIVFFDLFSDRNVRCHSRANRPHWPGGKTTTGSRMG